MPHEARNVGDVRAMMEPLGANDKHTIGVGQLSFGVPWGASWGDHRIATVSNHDLMLAV